MADPNTDTDPQDAAEAFDEDNLDPTETYKYRTFEENPEVIDLTRAEGDGDEEEDLSAPDAEEDGLERIGPDGYDESGLGDPADLEADDDDSPLVYVGDVENLNGAQGSAAHFESRAPLEDDDIEALGYLDEG